MSSEGPKAREGNRVRLTTDVEGYLSEEPIPRGTEGLVVEAYTTPQEGYAVDVMTRDLWSPEGPEWDNVILRPDQFEVVPHPCTMHIDAHVPMAAVAEQLARLIGGNADDDTASSEYFRFRVVFDPPTEPEAGKARDFGHFRYRITGEARPGVSVEDMADVVAAILEHYWAEGIGAVALCNYRDLLPRDGGLPEGWY